MTKQPKRRPTRHAIDDEGHAAIKELGLARHKQHVRMGRAHEADLEVAYLRGYQSGWEDHLIGRAAAHYVRTKREIGREDR